MRIANWLVPFVLLVGCSSDSTEGDSAQDAGTIDASVDARDDAGEDVGEGSADFPPGQPDVDELPGSDVVGHVVRIDGSLVISDSPDAADAVAGARVVLVDHHGVEVAATTSGADGRFALDDVARGPIAVTATLDTESSAPLWFSSLPDAQISLGTTWPIDRSTAGSLAGVRDASLDLVLATLQPLPAGTLVAPRREDPETSEYAVRIDRPAWFFVFDAEPFARQQHALRYVFVDAVSGDVRSIDDAPEWPRINRGVYFTDDVMWASFAEVDWDAAFESGEIDPTIDANISPEAVSLPPAMPEEITDNGSGMQKPGDPGARDVFVAMLIAGRDSASSADRVRMWGWCNREGIPIGNRRVVIPHEIARIRDVPASWAQALRELEGLVADALDEGRDPTLLVYITGHGLLEDGAPARELRVDWKDREMEWNAASIDTGSLISNTSACRLRIVVDVCYAETLALDLEVRVVRRPPSERPDFFSLSSSVSDQKSIMIPGWLGPVAGAGSLFTKRFAEHVTVVNADLSGALATGNQRINDNLDPAGQTPIAHVSSNWPTRCDPSSGDDTGVAIDAGPDADDVGDEVVPTDATDTDVADVTSTSRRFSTLSGPERAFVIHLGGAPWSPPFAERDAGASHAIVGGSGGIDLINLSTGERVSNPFAPSNFAAVPFRDPRGYDNFLLPGPNGVAQTSWNAEIDDFGFTQISPGSAAVFDLDVLRPDASGTSTAYTYATSNAAGATGTVWRQSWNAEDGFMRNDGEVRADAFPGGEWPAAPFGAYFGRSADEVVVTLLDGSVWAGDYSGPFGTEPNPMSLIANTEGEPRGLRCARDTTPTICVLPSFESSQLHIFELAEEGIERTATFDVPAGPVGIAVTHGDDGFDIATTSYELGTVAVWRYDAASDAVTDLGSTDACAGAAHVDFVGATDLLVTCHETDELVLLSRASLR